MDAIWLVLFLLIGIWAGHRAAKGSRWAFPFLVALIIIWIASRTHFIVRLF